MQVLKALYCKGYFRWLMHQTTLNQTYTSKHETIWISTNAYIDIKLNKDMYLSYLFFLYFLNQKKNP